MRAGLLRILCASAALVASPAFAFDCQKAATPSEKAICEDVVARAADEAMATAFVKRLAASPAEKPALLAAQALWLRDRDNACADEKPLAPCLARQSARRFAFLAAEPEAGPGAPGRLAPVLRVVEAGKGRAGLNLQLLKYPEPAAPAERAFNAEVDRLVGPLDEPDADDPTPGRFEHDRAMRLVYASPRLLSAHLDAYEDTGGAHPNSFTGNVNIDVAAGRALQLADLLDPRGAEAVFGSCERQVVAQKKARLGADAPLGPDNLKQLAKDVAAATAKLDAWSFSAEQASVTYDPYAVGAYAEGAYDCVIPYAQLKPLAKPGFPLP